MKATAVARLRMRAQLQPWVALPFHPADRLRPRAGRESEKLRSINQDSWKIKITFAADRPIKGRRCELGEQRSRRRLPLHPWRGAERARRGLSRFRMDRFHGGRCRWIAIRFLPQSHSPGRERGCFYEVSFGVLSTAREG